MKELLKAELLRRKRDNRNYSLRAFAQLLEIPPGRLSEIISGKRAASQKVQEKVLRHLGLQGMKDFFLEPEATKTPFSERDNYSTIHNEAFSVLADWYHFAILSLMDTRDFKNDAKWISKRLGISVMEAQTAIDNLLKVDLVETKNGKLLKKKENLKTSTDIESAALRLSHKQSLEQAQRALDEVQIELRDITSITMAVDLKKIAIAKKMIKEFRMKMSDLLESGDRTDVYNLNVQLVPLTKRSSI
jgi:uncharacterized protein (TIGR02147 family)